MLKSLRIIFIEFEFCVALIWLQTVVSLWLDLLTLTWLCVYLVWL